MASPTATQWKAAEVRKTFSLTYTDKKKNPLVSDEYMTHSIMISLNFWQNGGSVRVLSA